MITAETPDCIVICGMITASVASMTITGTTMEAGTTDLNTIASREGTTTAMIAFSTEPLRPREIGSRDQAQGVERPADLWTRTTEVLLEAHRGWVVETDPSTAGPRARVVLGQAMAASLYMVLDQDRRVYQGQEVQRGAILPEVTGVMTSYSDSADTIPTGDPCEAIDSAMEAEEIREGVSMAHRSTAVDEG